MIISPCVVAYLARKSPAVSTSVQGQGDKSDKMRGQQGRTASALTLGACAVLLASTLAGIQARQAAPQSSLPLGGAVVNAPDLFPFSGAADADEGRKSRGAPHIDLGRVSESEREAALDRFLFGDRHFSDHAKQQPQQQSEPAPVKPVEQAPARVSTPALQSKPKGDAVARDTDSARTRRRPFGSRSRRSSRRRSRYDDDDDEDDDDIELDEDDDDDDDDDGTTTRRKRRQRVRPYARSPSPSERTGSQFWSVLRWLFYMTGSNIAYASSTTLLILRFLFLPPLHLFLRSTSYCAHAAYSSTRAVFLHSLRPLRILVVAPIAYLLLGLYHVFVEIPAGILGWLAAEAYPLYLFLGAATTIGLGLGLGAAVVLLCGSFLFKEGSAFEQIFSGGGGKGEKGGREDAARSNKGKGKGRQGRQPSMSISGGEHKGGGATGRKRSKSLIGQAMQDLKRSAGGGGAADEAKTRASPPKNQHTSSSRQSFGSGQTGGYHGADSPPGMWSEEEELDKWSRKLKHDEQLQQRMMKEREQQAYRQYQQQQQQQQRQTQQQAQPTSRRQSQQTLESDEDDGFAARASSTAAGKRRSNEGLPPQQPPYSQASPYQHTPQQHTPSWQTRASPAPSPSPYAYTPTRRMSIAGEAAEAAAAVAGWADLRAPRRTPPRRRRPSSALLHRPEPPAVPVGAEAAAASAGEGRPATIPTLARAEGLTCRRRTLFSHYPRFCTKGGPLRMSRCHTAACTFTAEELVLSSHAAVRCDCVNTVGPTLTWSIDYVLTLLLKTCRPAGGPYQNAGAANAKRTRAVDSRSAAAAQFFLRVDWRTE